MARVVRRAGVDATTELDRVLPRCHFGEVHERRVAAPPERVFAAVREVTLVEMPVARLLIKLRGMRASPTRPILEQALEGFRVVAEEPSRELVLGAIAQPWKLRGGTWARGDFVGFDAPGYAKMALSFRFDDGVLTTETRVLLTDERSKRAFRRYWLVIRPFSGLIRRVWLRAIARRAEGVA